MSSAAIGLVGIWGHSFIDHKTQIDAQRVAHKCINEVGECVPYYREQLNKLPLSYQPIPMRDQSAIPFRPYTSNASDRYSKTKQYSTPVSWVNRRYDPVDLRASAPVPRYRPIRRCVGGPIGPEWRLEPELSEAQFNRSREDKAPWIVSKPNLRCQDWSTLRQMLPSRGRSANSKLTPRWGTAPSYPVTLTVTRQTSYPHLNSEMTRYVDDIRINDKQHMIN